MNIDAITTVLIAVVPTISAVVTTGLGFTGLVKTIKSLHKNNDDTVSKSTAKIERMEKKLNTINTKLASIEQYLVEQKEKRK